jgi:hypothetical protein
MKVIEKATNLIEKIKHLCPIAVHLDLILLQHKLALRKLLLAPIYFKLFVPM